jgi:histidinol-phosphatase (PHP family)
MLLQSLHTHSLYDDGQDTLARMAQNAEAAGLDALGFSGHSPLPFANDWAIDQSCLADYLREARSLQADFRGRFSLYCGLEWDSCSPLPEQKREPLRKQAPPHDRCCGRWKRARSRLHRSCR